ncbi:hypothetical protein BJV74DRAFT_540382 [Russula compacta]|nr:hypothetical protein BJV74DRAFT_540382 [Russula compacta]
MPATIDVGSSLGALLIGCFIAVTLSGIVAFQACIYFRMYPLDKLSNKVMVAVVWILDAAHTCLICTSLWKYLIANYGNVESRIRGDVPVTVALSIAVTSLVTLITHLFFLWRLKHLSKSNWFIIGPTFIMVIGRVSCALLTTTELIRLQTFPAYTAKYKSVFTLGLAFSSAVDVVITFGMCFYLQESRRGFGTMDDVIDAIIVYTINNGTLTCISTIISMICWLTMPHNLIFMALHFVIAKMYANSLFGTLNMRQSFRGRTVPPQENGNPMPVLFPDSFNRNNRSQQNHAPSLDFTEGVETKASRRQYSTTTPTRQYSTTSTTITHQVPHLTQIHPRSSNSLKQRSKHSECLLSPIGQHFLWRLYHSCHTTW